MHTSYYVGIDLAWGEHNPDGICVFEQQQQKAQVKSIELTHGDDALLALLASIPTPAPMVVAVDAPLVCNNPTGSRPVDRLTHTVFGKWKCGCHPANTKLVQRPQRLLKKINALGLITAWSGSRYVMEVYPHPAIVAWLHLDQRIPYKRGKVTERRREFARLQQLILKFWPRLFPALSCDEQSRHLLTQPWTKNIEDQTDALLCALMAYWHHLHQGRQSAVIGDLQSGFIVVPVGQFPWQRLCRSPQGNFFQKNC